MTSANFSVLPELQPSRQLQRSPRAPIADLRVDRPIDPATLTLATLLDEPEYAPALQALTAFGGTVGLPLDIQSIPTHLARAGVVGRISVPQEAGTTMLRQRVVVGATLGAAPLAPVPRLWRGLQRRADVLVDMRLFRTLPGSDAYRAGVQRDVLLFSQRVTERASAQREIAAESDTADQWTRARYAAELAYRHASAENRQVFLVLPIGRGTAAQRLFSDAMLRQARLQRLAPPRIVKAGLLSALLTGEIGPARVLAASVMTIEELAATTREAIGDCGPWPVVSVGKRATFIDMPTAAAGVIQPLPLLLALASMLQRSGRGDVAQQLEESVSLTLAALMRMREELGTAFLPPVDAFLRGVRTNWGRQPISGAAVAASSEAPAQGLRLRIETSLAAGAVRDTINTALLAAGVEVASVRALELRNDRGTPLVDVRLRGGLGESGIPDSAANAFASALGPALQCVSLEPWSPGATGDRTRSRTSVRAG
jgi:hypothetical protein